ncbi:DUSP14 [Cordylochernes scorpioides]|uniref:protein-serine/threonine phosphatase n=1 Tax=Cordylochernes scorpioides TaxID=51811 RepID=A0ABY6KJQ7_9ARAC|nr:DUSP14 [Cordylochernes scorpioides]
MASHWSAMTCMTGVSKVEDHLYLSGFYAITQSALDKNKITCIINATKDAEFPPKKKGLDTLRVPVEDFHTEDISPYFDMAVEKIVETEKKGGNTLVHCMAGISRSASICIGKFYLWPLVVSAIALETVTGVCVCAAYMMKHRGMDLKSAYHHVKEHRPIIHPNHGFFRQLIAYEKKLSGTNTVKMMKLEEEDMEIPDIYMNST